MKIKQLLNMNIPGPNSGRKAYELYNVSKRRSVELKKLLGSKYVEMLKPVSSLINKLPKKATEENRKQIQEAIDGMISWTAPRRFIEVLAEVDVKDIREANYCVYIFTVEMFNRISTNQNMAVELNNMIKSIKTTDDNGKNKGK